MRLSKFQVFATTNHNQYVVAFVLHCDLRVPRVLLKSTPYFFSNQIDPTSRLYGFLKSASDRSVPIVTCIFSTSDNFRVDVPPALNHNGKNPGYGLGNNNIESPARL